MIESGNNKSQAESLARKVSRRTLFGLAAANTALGTAYLAENRLGVITRLFAPDPNDIPSEIPPLLQGKDIPQTNEHYQSPLTVVQAGIDAYIRDGGIPFYKRPSYYVTQGEILRKVIFEQNLYDTSGKPYDAAVSFYRGAYYDPVDLYDDDPGTSSRIEAERRLQEVLGYTHPADRSSFGFPRYDDAQRTVINQTYAEQFSQTKQAIDDIRGTERVSTSVLFTHYLKKDGGDIAQSLLDTTLFIRFAARGDAQDMLSPRTFTEAAPDDNWGRKNAELLSSMFYDDFSSSVPLDWLLNNVPNDNAVLNTEDTSTNTQWKDYMPVNRAGTPYHIWSAIGMASIMDPALVEEAITFDELRTSWPEHGRIKVRADIETLYQIREIRGTFERYEVA